MEVDTSTWYKVTYTWHISINENTWYEQLFTDSELENSEYGRYGTYLQILSLFNSSLDRNNIFQVFPAPGDQVFLFLYLDFLPLLFFWLRDIKPFALTIFLFIYLLINQSHAYSCPSHERTFCSILD